MIQCFSNFEVQQRVENRYLRVCRDGELIRIPYRLFVDDRLVRRFLRDLSLGRCDTQCRLSREWNREENLESIVQFDRLKRQVAAHVPPVNRNIKILIDQHYTFLTKGTIRLSIGDDSRRCRLSAFTWFVDFVRNGRGESRGIASDQNFALLEDSITSACDGDRCYTVTVDTMVALSRCLAEGSVLA